MIDWIDVNDELPLTYEEGDEDEGNTWEASDVVLVKLEGTLELPFGFATYEIDTYDDGTKKAFWVDESDGWSYEDNVKVVAWAPLSNLY